MNVLLPQSIKWAGGFFRPLLIAYIIPLTFIKSSAQAEPPPNEFCPVMTEERASPEIFVEYEGRNVYLCCNPCRRRFRADPEKYLTNLPTDYFLPVSMEVIPEDAAPEETAQEPNNGSGAEDTKALRSIALLGKLHPLLVHFPIALVFAALVAESLSYRRTHRQQFKYAARFCILLAAAGGIMTAALGFAAAHAMILPASQRPDLESHRWLGIAAAMLLIISAITGEVASRRDSSVSRRLFLAFLVLTSAAIGLTGHFGAILVRGSDYFSF